jgi:hypothetical protein
MDETVLANLRTAGSVIDYMLRSSGQTPLRYADSATATAASAASGEAAACGEAATAASVAATGEATDNAAVAIVNGIHADLLSMMRCERHASRD